MKSLHSLSTVKRGDFLFKLSEMDGRILLVSHSPIFQYTNIRFFDSESMAKNFIEYLVMQSKEMKKEMTGKT